MTGGGMRLDDAVQTPGKQGNFTGEAWGITPLDLLCSEGVNGLQFMASENPCKSSTLTIPHEQTPNQVLLVSCPALLLPSPTCFHGKAGERV